MTNIPLIRLVDDDEDYRRSQKLFLGFLGFEIRDYGSAREFLELDPIERPGCLVLDIRMPEMTGIELQRELERRSSSLPVIFLTGHGDVETAVQTLQFGAFDFIEKRGDPMRLKASVERACLRSCEALKAREETKALARAFETLTPREKSVLVAVALGQTNKSIALSLGIGAETVKMHRANAFGKLGLQSALDAYRWLERCNPALLRGEAQP